MEAKAVALKITALDANHAIGHTIHGIYSVWRGETTLEGAKGLAPVAQELGVNGEGLFTVVEKASLFPNAEARAEIARALQAARSVKCAALVFEGGGFQAAAVRAITTTIYQLAGTPFPLRVFADVRVAARWMEGVQTKIDSKEVIASIAGLRSALDEQT